MREKIEISDLTVMVIEKNLKELQIKYPFYCEVADENTYIEIQEDYYQKIHVTKSYCSHTVDKKASYDTLCGLIENKEIKQISEQEFEEKLRIYKANAGFILTL